MLTIMILRFQTKIDWLVRCKWTHAQKTRKQYTADFKAKVVKEMLREEKTVGQLAAEKEHHHAHP